MNKKKPLISVLIPTYNQEAYIKKAIESALDQTYTPLEVIVSDDCSCDNTYEIACRMDDPRLSVYQNKTNIGRIKNYKKLLYQYSNGEYVINLDGDDYYIDADFLTKASKLIKNDVVLVFANRITRFLTYDFPTNYNFTQITEGLEIFELFLRYKAHIPHQTALFDSTLAKRIRFYEPDRHKREWVRLMELSVEGQVGFLSDKVAVKRIHGENISKQVDVDKTLENIFYFDQVTNFINDKKNKNNVYKLLHYLSYRKMVYLRSIVGLAVRNKQWRKLRRLSIEIFTENFFWWFRIFLSPQVIVSFCPKTYHLFQAAYSKYESKN